MAKKKSAETTTDASGDFEGKLRELEALVERLEQGDLPLEKSLEEFERGVLLTRACQEELRDAEQKVKILSGGMEQDFGGRDEPTDDNDTDGGQ